MKRASSIPYGYRKPATQALALSQTLVHGKNKNNRRQRNSERRLAEKSVHEMESIPKNASPIGLSIVREKSLLGLGTPRSSG